MTLQEGISSSHGHGFISDSRTEFECDGLDAKCCTVRLVLRQSEWTRRLLLNGNGDTQTITDGEVRTRCRRAKETIQLEYFGLAERRPKFRGGKFADNAGVFVDVLKPEYDETAGHVREECLVELVGRRTDAGGFDGQRIMTTASAADLLREQCSRTLLDDRSRRVIFQTVAYADGRLGLRSDRSDFFANGESRSDLFGPDGERSPTFVA